MTAAGSSAEDVSTPPILQWFEAKYDTMVRRTPDLFLAGYGAVWVPPTGRAGRDGDGFFSGGYDPYDRFDLGRPGHPTRYGTEEELKKVARSIHRAGVDLHIDFVINHNGFSGTNDAASNAAFRAAGGYPGFFMERPGDVDGDFHSGFASGDLQGRLSGLIDIAHEKNYQAIRNPVPGFANNLPAGTTPQFGRLANVPTENNRRFYPDKSLQPIMLFDPRTGEQNIAVYPFNPDNPLAGDPVAENAMGYLMRNAQWLVQTVGVDGFRIDAAKHVEGFVLDYFDRAVYRSNPRKLLNGATKHVFSYGEAFTDDTGVLLSHVRKTINPNDPGRIGANRDAIVTRPTSGGRPAACRIAAATARKVSAADVPSHTEPTMAATSSWRSSRGDDHGWARRSAS
jgi:glycosidase